MATERKLKRLDAHPMPNFSYIKPLELDIINARQDVEMTWEGNRIEHWIRGDWRTEKSNSHVLNQA